jgi:hypothetical protein
MNLLRQLGEVLSAFGALLSKAVWNRWSPRNVRYRRKARQLPDRGREVEAGSDKGDLWRDGRAPEGRIGYGDGESDVEADYDAPPPSEVPEPETAPPSSEDQAEQPPSEPAPPSEPSGQRRPPIDRGSKRRRPSDLSDAFDDVPSLPLDEPNTFRRTPHIKAPEEFRVKHGAVVEIAVYLDKARLSDVEEGVDVVLDAPSSVKSIELGVLVTTSEHFDQLGNPYKTLQLERDSPKSERLSFSLEVVRPDAGEEIGISALFVHAGRPCGRVARRWTVRNATARTQTPGKSRGAGQQQGGSRGGGGAGGSGGGMYVHAGANKPDLSVLITAPINDGQSYVCSVQTDLLEEYRDPVSGPWALPMLAADFVRRTLDDFIDPSLTPTARKRALKAAGFTFFDAAPQVFKDVFWELVKADKLPRSIFIASIEPSIPWELMIPFRNDATGQPEDPRQPLGVEFPIGRWVRGDHISPAQAIKVESSFVVAPDYAPPERALDSSAELALLTARLAGRRVTPASVDTLDSYFAANEASLIHFVCHGVAGSSDDSIFLDNDEELRSSSVRALDGFRALCRTHRPLVFLNSCETGRLVPSLVGGAGFPRSFGDIGARAIIAPLWSVDDKLAHRVAVEIYQAALDRPDATLAEIVRDIRKKAYASDPFEDTWAAYALYADPLTKLET